MEKIREMLLENPGDSFLQHALALECIKLGQDEEAKSLFRNILSNEPGYIGSYFHLARLLERMGDIGEAVKVCERGMAEAKKAGDHHALNELKSAYDELIF